MYSVFPRRSVPPALQERARHANGRRDAAVPQAEPSRAREAAAARKAPMQPQSAMNDGAWSGTALTILISQAQGRTTQEKGRQD